MVAAGTSWNASQLICREAPVSAGSSKGFSLLLRHGYVVELGPGLVAGLPLFQRTLARLAERCRQTFMDLSAQEVSLPASEGAALINLLIHGGAGERSDLVAGFGDGNGASPDVFLRMLGTGMTRLVSHGPVLADGGVGGGSVAPRVSADGQGIAFESDATSLVAGDTNGVRDVFYTLVEASLTLDLNRASVADGGVEGTGGDSRHGSIAVLNMATHDVRVVFESDKTNLVTPAHGSTNAYLFESLSGTTTLLNQRRDMGGTQLGTIKQLAAAPPIPASSFRPMIAPGGQFALFDSDADNIDVIREVDESSGQDVFIADLNRFASDGFVLPFRVSVDEMGFHANAPSSAVAFGAFASGTGVFPSGLVAYVSDATNLGVPDGGRHLLSFVTETPVGNAAFSANPVTGPAPLMVTFTDASTGVIDGFTWDFGDGSNSTAQHPVHSYTKAGLYTVTLTIDGPFGMSQTVMTDLITVQ